MKLITSGIVLTATYLLFSPIALGQGMDAGGGYEHIPGGVIAHSTCIHPVPAGGFVDYADNVYDNHHTLIASYAGTCSHPRRDLPRTVTPPPAGPAGAWYAWAIDYAPVASNYDKIYANWVVPPIPPLANWNDGQVIFLFNGIMDGPSTTIIQPVLEYDGYTGAGHAAGTWRMMNWAVNGNNVYYDNTPTIVTPGDVIYGAVFLSTFGEYITQYSDVTTSTTVSFSYEANNFMQFDARGVTAGTLEAYYLKGCNDLPNTTGVQFYGVGTYQATDALWNGGLCNWANPWCYTPVTNYAAGTPAAPTPSCTWNAAVNHAANTVNLTW